MAGGEQAKVPVTWPMEYAVTVVFMAPDADAAADVLDRCSTIAAEYTFTGGWGEPFVNDPASDSSGASA